MRLSIFLTSFCLLPVLLGFSAEKPSQILKKNLIEDYQILVNETIQLNELAQEVNAEKIKTQFFQTRLAYKKIELFLTHLDRQYMKDYINGAPLLHTERKAPNLVILEPLGFQVMEEVLFEEDYPAFFELAEKLNERIHHFQTLLPTARFTERIVFESLREEVIRLIAMGITGFDTPSCENTMAECQVVVKSMEAVMHEYNSYLTPEQIQEIKILFATATPFFEADFASFDRFEFIRTFAQPLYALLLKTQNALFIETRSLASQKVSSLNYESQTIFSEDFLHHTYYTAYSTEGKEEERIELGKLLFFDPILSSNNERACASCHHPDKAFSDGKKTALAFNGHETLSRNSPGLINSIYNTRLFWDARAETAADQVEHVLFNPAEFNTNYDELQTKISQCGSYLTLFRDAFPTYKRHDQPLVSRYTIVASIGAYIQSLRGMNSPFDQSMNATAEDNLVSQEVKDGFNVFAGKGKCATCHFIPTFAGNVPPLYTDTETEVLGIPTTNDQKTAKLDPDKGRYLNGRPKERAPFYQHSFKTPTLRNSALTAPYMHNGVFNTLEEVVEYYNVGGGHGWGIAPENATLPPDSLHLTEYEKKALVTFMESLTDTTGLTNVPKYLPESSNQSLNNRMISGSY